MENNFNKYYQELPRMLRLQKGPEFILNNREFIEATKTGDIYGNEIDDAITQSLNFLTISFFVKERDVIDLTDENQVFEIEMRQNNVDDLFLYYEIMDSLKKYGAYIPTANYFKKIKREIERKILLANGPVFPMTIRGSFWCYFTKKQILELCKIEGFGDSVREREKTCANGQRDPENAWELINYLC